MEHTSSGLDLMKTFPDVRWPMLCERDREFAEHTARVCAQDLAWENGLPVIPFDLIVTDAGVFGRRDREKMNEWRHATALDWTKFGYQKT